MENFSISLALCSTNQLCYGIFVTKKIKEKKKHRCAFCVLGMVLFHLQWLIVCHFIFSVWATLIVIDWIFYSIECINFRLKKKLSYFKSKRLLTRQMLKSFCFVWHSERYWCLCCGRHNVFVCCCWSSNIRIWFLVASLLTMNGWNVYWKYTVI